MGSSLGDAMDLGCAESTPTWRLEPTLGRLSRALRQVRDQPPLSEAMQAFAAKHAVVDMVVQ